MTSSSSAFPLRGRASRLTAAVGLVAAVAAGSVALPAVASQPAAGSPQAASASACGIVWGSLDKSAGTLVTAPLRAVRAGRHACYDRLVLDLGPVPAGYRVGYVATVYAEGSGDPVPVRGGARLAVHLKAPAGFVPSRRTEVVDVTGYSTFRQVSWGESFEGYTTLALGVRARLPFRVFTIDDGATSRLVVDVAHRW